MGTSGFILKKRENVDIYQMIDEVKAAAGRAGLLSPVEDEFYDKGNRGGYVYGGIANTFEEIPGKEATQIRIYSAGYGEYDGYDWILEGGHLIDAVVFEVVRKHERILLDFLYEYFRSNPEDYFWCEGDWYYTADDIFRIKQRDFHPYWCYRDPRLDEDSIRRMEEEHIKRKGVGTIVKRRGSAGIGQVMDAVKGAAARAKLRYCISSEFHDYEYGGVYVTGNIADTFEEIPGAEDVSREDLAVSIYSTEQEGGIQFNWLIKEGCDLVEVVTFEEIGYGERILLDFLYEYLKSNPEDYFWCYGDWYYTLDDIARIKQKEFDPLWCYKYPTGQTFQINKRGHD